MKSLVLLPDGAEEMEVTFDISIAIVSTLIEIDRRLFALICFGELDLKLLLPNAILQRAYLFDAAEELSLLQMCI